MASAVPWRPKDKISVLLTSVAPHNKVFACVKEQEKLVLPSRSFTAQCVFMDEQLQLLALVVVGQ